MDFNKGEKMSSTTLKLSLAPETFVWKPVHPMAKNFKAEEQSVEEMTLSQTNPGPVQVVLEELPKWAQIQVISSVRSGQIVNTGDKIVLKKRGETPKEAAPTKTTKKKTSGKKKKEDSVEESAE
jgi:hypothetical protein